MGPKFAVIGGNLVVAYEENKIFALLPQLYPISSTFLYVTAFSF